jgi:hypothetical protein
MPLGISNPVRWSADLFVGHPAGFFLIHELNIEIVMRNAP